MNICFNNYLGSCSQEFYYQIIHHAKTLPFKCARHCQAS